MTKVTIHQTEIQEMQPHVQKIVAAIGFLIREASERWSSITQYDIVKSLFLADRKHLNQYGRPIIFDNYYAMKHGPVPNLAYNLLKFDAVSMRKHGLDRLPWGRRGMPNSRAFHYFLQGDFDMDALSKSDVEALRDALTVVKSLGFSQIRKLTHEDSAYVDAWDTLGDDSGSYQMSYSLLFDSPNKEVAEEIAFLSKHL